MFKARLVPAPEEVIRWICSLPGPLAAVYESGPTGFGLSRSLAAGGIRCEVAAASKLQRPAWDQVKTDARDVLHLARLLRLDEVAVRVPSEVEESARDLVSCREAARADLMRARHRLSKLLLRHGIVHRDGLVVVADELHLADAGGESWPAEADDDRERRALESSIAT